MAVAKEALPAPEASDSGSHTFLSSQPLWLYSQPYADSQHAMQPITVTTVTIITMEAVSVRKLIDYFKQFPPLKHTEQNIITAMRITTSNTIIWTLKFCHHILLRSVRPVL
jgi:hypothetical protein